MSALEVVYARNNAFAYLLGISWPARDQLFTIPRSNGNLFEAGLVVQSELRYFFIKLLKAPNHFFVMYLCT